MKNLPKISIVIPSYNKAKYIQETLESIVSQKHSSVEIIIQDGGSTDGTLEIIKEYAKKYPKIISWVSKKDKGQTDAINKGMKKATGDILAFINADDVYEKEVFEKVAKIFSERPDTFWVVGEGRVIDKSGKEIARTVTAYKNFLLRLNRCVFLLMVNYLFQSSVFFSKKAYDGHGPFRGVGKIVMEYDLWLKLFLKEHPIVLLDKLSNFRLEGNSFSIRQRKLILSQDVKILKSNTNNLLILFLHRLHNMGRIFMVSRLLR